MNERPANARLLGALLMTGITGVTAAACNMLIGLEPGQFESSSSASTGSGGGGPGTSVSASAAVSTGSNSTGGGGTSSSTSTGSTSSTGSGGTTCPAPATACNNDPAWAHWRPEPGPGCTDRFTQILDTVFDKVTGLTWQRTLPAMTMKWDDAISYCQSYVAGGLKGFRLPTRIELVSIADYARKPPTIDPVAFPNTPQDAFWTSSVSAADAQKAWFITFGQFSAFGGAIREESKKFSYSVRCVR